jgi:hypothetical protein
MHIIKSREGESIFAGITAVLAPGFDEERMQIRRGGLGPVLNDDFPERDFFYKKSIKSREHVIKSRDRSCRSLVALSHCGFYLQEYDLTGNFI